MARKRRKEGRTEKGFGSLKRQGKGWHLTVKLHGKVYNHATGKTDLEDAKEERDRFIRDIKLAEAAKNTTNINGDSRKYPEEVVTIDELLDDYIDYMKNEKKCKDAKQREDKIELHLRIWPGRLASSITTDELRALRRNL